MPYSRRRSYRRSRRVRRVVALTRTGRVYRRLLNRPMDINRSMVSYRTVHNFKSNVLYGNFITTTGVGATGQYLSALPVHLNDLPNVTAYTGLYDQYRITRVDFRIMHRSTSISIPETGASDFAGMPFMYYFRDLDDSNVPASLNVVREYANAKHFEFTPDRRCCTIRCKPNTLRQVYQSAIATSYEPAFGRWIDIADGGNTVYYTYKFGVQTPTGGNPTTAAFFDIEATYYFQCRQPRA